MTARREGTSKLTAANLADRIAGRTAHEADETAAFYRWWEAKRRADFARAYGPELPFRAEWGRFSELAEKEAWLARAALAQPQGRAPQWISVKDRLPGPLVPCIAWCQPKGVKPFAHGIVLAPPNPRFPDSGPLWCFSATHTAHDQNIEWWMPYPEGPAVTKGGE
jgi:hypothetical protein